jgi:hypothetical protein
MRSPQCSRVQKELDPRLLSVTSSREEVFQVTRFGKCLGEGEEKGSRSLSQGGEAATINAIMGGGVLSQKIQANDIISFPRACQLGAMLMACCT